MGAQYALLDTDLFLFLLCYENDLMFPPSDNNQAGDIEPFNSTS